jgi:hypothetical protein
LPVASSCDALDHRQRDRHSLCAFVAAARRHDDFGAVIGGRRGAGSGIVARGTVGGGRFGFGGSGGYGRQQQRGAEKKLQTMIGRETVH